jgi:hypothetical protein
MTFVKAHWVDSISCQRVLHNVTKSTYTANPGQTARMVDRHICLNLTEMCLLNPNSIRVHRNIPLHIKNVVSQWKVMLDSGSRIGLAMNQSLPLKEETQDPGGTSPTTVVIPRVVAYPGFSFLSLENPSCPNDPQRSVTDVKRLA